MNTILSYLFCSLLLVLSHHFPRYHAASPSKASFAVFLDAGSTSTKLKVYKWNPPTPGGIPEIKISNTEKFKPGLASFFGKQSELKKNLDKILAVASLSVPATKRAETPVFVFGTAGFRYLLAQQSQQLMDGVRTVLSGSGFRFTDKNAQVISGEEEAAYLWVAVNYLEGYFDCKISTGEDNRDCKSTGAMEMGGGSLQITFQPNSPLYGEEFHVTVGGHLYQIYTQSFFNFGANGINSQILERLALANSTGDLLDPCMLRGDSVTTTLNSGHKKTFRGTGDPVMCQRQLADILNPSPNCQLKPCAIGNVYLPIIPDMKFYATGPFAPRGVIRLGEDNVLNIPKLKEAAENHCRSTMLQLQRQGKDTKFASNDCLLGLYVPELLTRSFRFPLNTRNIVNSKTINGKRIDWALGAILLQLNGEYPLIRKKRLL